MSLSPPILARTHAAAFTQQRPWTTPEFAALLESPGLILCGDAKSFLLGRVVAGEAELLTVATDPKVQGQGRGHALIQQFIEIAHAQGAETAFLEVAADNAPAIHLYEKNNFTQVGRRPRYYSQPDGAKIDAIVMQKRL